jgi:hypothetical protein
MTNRPTTVIYDGNRAIVAKITNGPITPCNIPLIPTNIRQDAFPFLFLAYETEGDE